MEGGILGGGFLYEWSGGEEEGEDGWKTDWYLIMIDE
jgi:hypothetical protein